MSTHNEEINADLWGGDRKFGSKITNDPPRYEPCELGIDTTNCKHEKFAICGEINAREFVTNSPTTGTDLAERSRFVLHSAINRREFSTNSGVTGTDIAWADREQKRRNTLQTRMSRERIPQVADAADSHITTHTSPPTCATDSKQQL